MEKQKQAKVVDGPMDGDTVHVSDHTSKFSYFTGDVYLRNADGDFYWSRQETEMEKRRLNEFLARKKAKRR